MPRTTFKECGCQVNEFDRIIVLCDEHKPITTDPVKPKRRKKKPNPVIEKPVTDDIESIVNTLKKLKIKPSWLDEPVHNTASSIATKINNTGMLKQVDFLLRSGWSGKEIIDFFDYVKGGYNDS